MTPRHHDNFVVEPYANTIWDDNDAPTLNSLLRGEISAAETYDLAIGQFEGRADAVELRRIRDEHHAAMSLLRDRVRGSGGDPVDDSGAWGTFATVVTGAAMAFGSKPVLSALRQGEEHGISAYQKAVNSDISAESRRLIESELLPLCRQHVTSLKLLGSSPN